MRGCSLSYVNALLHFLCQSLQLESFICFSVQKGLSSSRIDNQRSVSHDLRIWRAEDLLHQDDIQGRAHIIPSLDWWVSVRTKTSFLEEHLRATRSFFFSCGLPLSGSQLELQVASLISPTQGIASAFLSFPCRGVSAGEEEEEEAELVRESLLLELPEEVLPSEEELEAAFF